ncbi:HPr kinase/phosphorylase [Brucella sp. IR073]|uniref:HPr kinase/phosphorylase n=1 Tax=unclassified Brucella TaxID=2632610 RepID=UPI003B9838F3
MGKSENIHATSLLLGDRGVLIAAPSGAGKSALALALIQSRRSAGGFAALVSDDRTVVRAVNGRLIASPPETLAGGIEVRGAGLFRIAHEKAAILHLAVDLVPEKEAIRYPDGAKRTHCHVALPLLRLVAPGQHGAFHQACQAIEAALFMPQWPLGGL